MKIGIDISQLVYENTGVANYLQNLMQKLLEVDKKNEYVLFFASLRKEFPISNFKFLNKSQIPALPAGRSNFKIRKFKIPLILLDFLWNKLHILPIEWFIGNVDIFITSDWTEPPVVKAKKATILYDLIIYRNPGETDSKIIQTQKRKLNWVKKESDMIFCISQATKKDAMEILGIDSKRLKVIYPGM